MRSSASIEFVEICFRYPAAHERALDRVSFRIESEEMCVIVGPSGSGKSTALGIVSGLLGPEYGRLLLDGRNIVPLDPRERHVGWVPQSYGLFEHMNVRENIGFGLKARRERRSRAQDRIDEMIALCELEGLELRSTRELSGGQRQRVAIARALAVAPRVLLLDEPFAALDSQLRLGLRARVKHLLKEAGITTIFVTHDQSEAMALADRIAILDKGRLVQFGSPEEIWENPSTPFVARFFGNASMIRSQFAHDASPPTRLVSRSSPPSEDAIVALRSSDIECSPVGESARVNAVEYLGGQYLINAVLADGQTLNLLSDKAIGRNAEIKVRIKPGKSPKVFGIDE